MNHRPIPPIIKPPTRDELTTYAMQLTSDPERAEVFVNETLSEAAQMTTLDTAAKVRQFILVTLRIKCYDYARLGKSPELMAAELNIPLCQVRPEIDAIVRGKFF